MNNYSRVILFIILICVLTFGASCRRDSVASPYIDGDYPDMVLYDSSYRFGRPGSDVLEMRAETITIYSSKNLTILENSSFSQSDDLFGTCEHAESTDNSKVSLSGSVHVEKKSDNLMIDCDNLLWDDDSRVLTTDGFVHVTYDDGTSLDAVGFKAFLDSNVYEFTRIEKGVMTNEE